MNWKLRWKNKTTLAALIGCVVAFVYQMIGIVGIVPAISESQITQLIGMLLNILVALGVIVDPTTKGVGDSMRARGYNQPI